MPQEQYKTEKINADNIDSIKEIYEDFRANAMKIYKYEADPLEFSIFKEALSKEILNGLILFEDSKPAGLLIYVIEPHKAIELNILHIPDKKNINKKRLALTSSLQDLFKDKTDWKVISYPMLGFQETFVRDITSLKFQLVGEAMVKFDLTNAISYKVLQKSEAIELPKNYTFATWDDKYLDSAVEIIHNAFKNTKDAYFDPRFLSLEGSADVVNKITNNVFGYFLKEETKLILNNDKVEGICFANVATIDKANIPLIAVKKDIRNKGLGKLLLKTTVQAIIAAISNKKMAPLEINAAVETDNYPALKMYRRLGFREDYTYTHAYFSNPNYKD